MAELRRRPRAGAGLPLLLPAGKDRHPKQLDRLPAHPRVPGQGGARVHALGHQRLCDCFLSRPDPRVALLRHAAGPGLAADCSARLRDLVGRNRLPHLHSALCGGHHHPVRRAHPGRRAIRRRPPHPGGAGRVCLRAGGGRALLFAAHSGQPRGTAPAHDHHLRDGGHQAHRRHSWRSAGYSPHGCAAGDHAALCVEEARGGDR